MSAAALTIVTMFASLMTIASVASATGATATVMAAGHGVKLQLRITRDTYPKDALVPVRITLTNLTSHFVPLCGYCSAPGLTAEVMNGSGKVVWPVDLPDMPAPLGPGPGVRNTIGLRPHASMTTKQYVILRGNRVRAVVRLGAQGQSGQLATPALTVKLDAEPAPRLDLQLQPQVQIAFHGVAALSKPVLYSYSYVCEGGVRGGSYWISAPGSTITPSLAPDCGQLAELHVIAGQIGHRVGRLDYRSPPPTPSPKAAQKGHASSESSVPQPSVRASNAP